PKPTNPGTVTPEKPTAVTPAVPNSRLHRPPNQASVVICQHLPIQRQIRLTRPPQRFRQLIPYQHRQLQLLQAQHR
ncbi:hypothetical protein, partial [Lactiplantibacillus plantarum]